MNTLWLRALAVTVIISPSFSIINQDYNDFTDVGINYQDLGQVLQREIQELSSSNSDYLQRQPYPIDYQTPNKSGIEYGINIRNGTATDEDLNSIIYNNKVRNEDANGQDSKSGNYKNEIDNREAKSLEKRETEGLEEVKLDKETALVYNNSADKGTVRNTDNATVQIGSVYPVEELNETLRAFRGIEDEDGRFNGRTVNRINQAVFPEQNVNNKNQVESKPKSLVQRVDGSELEQNLPQPLNLMGGKDTNECCGYEYECNFKKIIQMGRVLDAVLEKMGTNLRKDLGVCKRGKLFDQCPGIGDEETIAKIINEMVGCIKQTLKGDMLQKSCAPLHRELYSFLIWLLHGSEGGEFCPPTVPDIKTRYTYLFHENQHKPHTCGSASHSDRSPKRLGSPFTCGDPQHIRPAPPNSNEMVPAIRVQNEHGQVQYVPNTQVKEIQRVPENAQYQKKLPQQATAYLNVPDIGQPDIVYRKTASNPVNSYKDKMDRVVYPQDIEIDYSDTRRKLRDVGDSYDNDYYDDDEKDATENNLGVDQVASEGELSAKLEDCDTYTGLQDSMQKTMGENSLSHSNSTSLKEDILELNRTKRDQSTDTARNLTLNHTERVGRKTLEINQGTIRTASEIELTMINNPTGETIDGSSDETNLSSTKSTKDVGNESVTTQTNIFDTTNTSQLLENGKTTNGFEKSRDGKDLCKELIKGDKSNINASMELKQTDINKSSMPKIESCITNEELSSLNSQEIKPDENVKYNQAKWKYATGSTIAYTIKSSTSKPKQTIINQNVTSTTVKLFDAPKSDNKTTTTSEPLGGQYFTADSIRTANGSDLNKLKITNVTENIANNIVARDDTTVVANEDKSNLERLHKDKPNKEKRSESINILNNFINNIKEKKVTNSGKCTPKFDSYEEPDIEDEDEDDLDFKSEEEDSNVENPGNSFIENVWSDDLNDFDSQFNHNLISSFFKKPFLRLKTKSENLNQKRSKNKNNKLGYTISERPKNRKTTEKYRITENDVKR